MKHLEISLLICSSAKMNLISNERMNADGSHISVIETFICMNFGWLIKVVTITHETLSIE